MSKLRAALFVIAVSFCTPARAQPLEVNRVLRTFDFEERRLGNVEELPMHWSKVDGAGLPHYVNGGLASDRARSGRYSFRFDLNGGSLIYRYESGQIRVQRDAHYRVEGYVQTTAMPHARARLTAYFTDPDGHVLTNSIRHSDLYAAAAGLAGEAPQWQKLSVELGAAQATDETDANPREAAFLVIEVGLLQPAVYSLPHLGERTLYPQDINGTAWFDDITVSQVPKVTLSTDKPGNIFRRSEPLRLSVLVNDRFTDDLAAQLVIRDAVDRVVYQKSGALDLTAAETLGPGQKRMSLPLPEELPPGWYQASLVMSSQGQLVGTKTLDLVRLADDGRPIAPDPRFGLIATDLPFEGWSELPAILSLMSAGRVKLAVWSDSGDVQHFKPHAFDQLLERLADLRISPTACLLSLPPSVTSSVRRAATQPAVDADSYRARPSGQDLPASSWMHVLRVGTEAWQPQLAELVARHASHLARWQLGADGSDSFVTNPAMRQVYQKVYGELANLLQTPDLAMPWPAWYELDGNLPATIALHVKPDVLPSQIPLYLDADAKDEGRGATVPRNLSVYLEPLNVHQYGREMQIRDFAQRIAFALAAHANRIDIKLPFDVSRDDESLAKRPQELLIIVRTILMTLSNATYKGTVPIAEGVEALLFDRNGQGVLMLWNRGSDAAVKPLALNLGDRAMRVDLWGNVTPLIRSAESGTQTQHSALRTQHSVSLELGPMPIFLIGIDGQLAQLRASVAFDNDHIESSFKAHVRRLRFTNPYQSSISGSVKLSAPKGWIINPPTCAFSLNPGETFSRELTIEFPYNSFAGNKTITAEFQVQAETNTAFSQPLVLKLGLSDVGLQTVALRDGKDVIVQQMITNYGEGSIDYTAHAIFPGQARQERIIAGLAPGRTVVKRYRFIDARSSPGARVRSGVKELRGTRMLNDEVEIQ